ncbi:hypothetical protein LCGC14_0945370 [marine sediment metagenome]|uniref:Uncharacterized protein n=1 Tax=marine sediment metagenome TaxID=412755 RepID=A0A0F9NIV8_9ZZZZ
MLVLILGIFLISLVTPVQQTLGTFKSGECVNFIQICDNCTYNNISAVLYPNSTVALSNIAMTKDDTYYNYSFCSTSTLGNYIVNGFGDLDGVKTSWSYDFDITSSGFKQTTSEALGSSMYLILIISLIMMFSYIGFRLTNSDELWVFGIFLIFIALILLIYVTYLNMFYYKFYIGSLNTSLIPSIIFGFLLFSITAGLITAALLLLKRIPKYIGKLFKGVVDKEDGWDENAFD